MNRVQGGFDNNSGNNQSAQKPQQEKISQITVPLTCLKIKNIIDQSQQDPQANANNHYDYFGAFENVIITAKFELLSSNTDSNRMTGRLSDSTGQIEVVIQKPKTSESYPEYIQAYETELQINGNRHKYVRAMLKLRKKSPIQLLYFSVVNDANEITRHNLDVCLRYLQKKNGIEDFMTLIHQEKGNNQAASVQVNLLQNYKVDPNLSSKEQVLELMKFIQSHNPNEQIPKQQIVQYFAKSLNQVQINQIFSQLVSSNDIFAAKDDSYFVNC